MCLMFGLLVRLNKIYRDISLDSWTFFMLLSDTLEVNNLSTHESIMRVIISCCPTLDFHHPGTPVTARFDPNYFTQHIILLDAHMQSWHGCEYPYHWGFECTKCFMHSALKLSLEPVTCKEALFKRCFNTRWQCPPLSMPSREVSVVATRSPDQTGLCG